MVEVKSAIWPGSTLCSWAEAQHRGYLAPLPVRRIPSDIFTQGVEGLATVGRIKYQACSIAAQPSVNLQVDVHGISVACLLLLLTDEGCA